jgi:protocatechuate 3,4-dioxygenase beta subunit
MRTILLSLALGCTLAAQERPAAPTPAAAGFQVSGTVVNAANSQPLAQASVTITSVTDNRLTRSVKTGGDGRFRFDRLKAGKYALSAERRGFAPQGYEQHEGQFSTAIAVGANLETANLVFRISPGASISGHLTDEHGDAVRHARVMLIADELREGHRAKRMAGSSGGDDQGYYHFAHLKAGTYYIAVSATPWYAQAAQAPGVNLFRSSEAAMIAVGAQNSRALDVAYSLTFYPGVTDATAASAITLQAGDRASADITLRAVPALHIRINNAGGGEAQRFFTGSLAQRIFDGIEIPVAASTQNLSPNMAIMTGMAPGRYLLRVGTRRFGPGQQAQEAEDAPQAMRVRELDLAGDTELDANETAAAASVSGTVKLADGQAPPKPMMIELRNRAGQSLGARASAGEFTFARGAPAGSYEVLMSSGEGLFIRSVAATGAKVAGRVLHIGGSDAVRLSIVAGAGIGRVEGVALRDGKPQSGAMILLVPRDPVNNRPLFRRDQSDSDGTFTLATVLPGRYTLLALENGWTLEWANPEVLKPYLAGGTSVIVEPNGKHEVRLKAQ